jgi:hypothetical protein
MQTREQWAHETELFVRSAITRMLGLKLLSGSSVQELRDFLDECIGEAVSLHSARDSNSAFDLISIAGIVRSWHTETEFLKPDGMPKPLTPEGRSGLKKLVSMHFPTSLFTPVFATLRRNGLIKKHGGRAWVQTERHAGVPKATAEMLRHLAEGVARLAETVMRNTHTAKKEDLLFERSCKVFHLPASEAGAFREYMQKQGVAFIMAADDWLETRTLQTAGPRKSTCAAGAYAFAFIDDCEGQLTKKTRSVGAKRRG